MLTATLDTDVSQLDTTREQYIVDGTISYSGSYPTNGDTVDFSQLGIPSLQPPVRIEIYEATTAANKPAYGAYFIYLPGSTLANGVVEIFNGTTQVGTATYSSIFGTIPVVLRFRAWFKSQI